MLNIINNRVVELRSRGIVLLNKTKNRIYSKIKKITVKPKSELSYQSHKFRNEHWIVLNGTATVKKNGNVY